MISLYLLVSVGENSFAVFSRHTYCKFPTCNLTASIISLWSVDLGIKGCLRKACVSVWEQNGWPWHVMTVCHFVAFGTNHSERVLNHTALLFHPMACREPCFKEVFDSLFRVLPRGFVAQSEKDLVKAHRDGVLKFWWMLSGCLCTVHMKLCHIIKSEMIWGID